MKRFLVLLVVGLFLAAAGNAFAQSSEVYYWDGTQWVSYAPTPVADRDALLFRSGAGETGECNKPEWEILVHIYAHIAQWIEFDLQYTQWDWYIRKPGCYAGNSIDAWLASNGDVLVNYEDFADLTPVLPENSDHNPIPVWYSFEMNAGSVFEADARGWVAAGALNADDDLLLDVGPDWVLHDKIAWKLWNKICVERCNSACDYENHARIIITLNEQKTWIDSQGGWAL